MFDMGIESFFKTINRRCESCNDEAEDWNVHVNPANAYGGIPAVDANGGAIVSVMPVMVMSCKHCGYIRMYAADQIQKMVDIQNALENQPKRMCEYGDDGCK